MPENQNPSSPNPYELITEELIIDALVKECGKDVELLSWEIKDFTNKGDNLMSLVTSIVVKYKEYLNEYEQTFIAKLNPLRKNSSLTDVMENFYGRETVILSTIIEGMNKSLNKISLPYIKTPQLLSRSLEKGREAFIEEDLRQQGFKMPDRREGLDLNHSYLVMEELGRFHASSLLFEESIYPSTISQSSHYFEEQWLDMDHHSFKVLSMMIRSQTESAANYLKNYSKFDRCVKWLNENAHNFGKYYVEGYTSSKPFRVLIHGDLRTANILFRYNENCVPIDLRMIDLQTSKMSSPACDIGYFFYSSLAGEFRKKNFQKLLYAYYQSFSKVLIFSKKNVPFTFKELEDEVERKKIFGFVCGLYLIPVALGEGDDAYDWGEIEDDQLEEYAQAQNEKFLLITKRKGLFQDRFLSLFEEMMENNLF